MNEYLTKKRSSGDYGKQETLPPSLQTKMNQSFGMDFSSVKVYRNDEMAGTGMKGLASGNRVILSREINLNTLEGQAVLGHELSHIHAQSQGIGMGNSGLLNNAALEQQADTEGRMAAMGQSVYGAPGGMPIFAGMQNMGGLQPLSGGLSASAGAPMQALKPWDWFKNCLKPSNIVDDENPAANQGQNVDDPLSQRLPEADYEPYADEKLNSINSFYFDKEPNLAYSELLINEGCANKSDFSGFDPEVSRVITKKILMTMKEFPLLPKMNFIGSMSAFQKGLNEIIKNFHGNKQKKDREYEKLWNILHSSQDAHGMSFRWVEPEDDPNDSIPEMSGYDGVTFSSGKLSTMNLFKAEATQAVKEQHWVKGSERDGSMVDHELGHEIDRFVEGYADDVIKGIWTEFSKQSKRKKKDQLSGYGSQNIREFIAESWCKYRNNPWNEVGEPAQSVVTRLKELYHNKVENPDTKNSNFPEILDV